MVKAIALRNLHNQVVHELGQLIISGELKPGETLPREELLAEQMNVSRTALREAIKVLSAKGLIESRQKTGTRVRDPVCWNQLDADVLGWRCATMPTESFVEKLVEMREVIEPAAAAAAARRHTPEQLIALKEAYDAMEAATDLDAWTQADLLFHERLLLAGNNELMSSLFAVIATALDTYFRLSARNASNFNVALPQHLKVYEAIKRKQPEMARQAMLKVVTDSRNNIRRRSGKATAA